MLVNTPNVRMGFVKMDETLKRILDLMKEQDVTAVGMEDLLGVPRGSFSNWKRGMRKSYYEHIDKIADRLGVTINYLVRGKEIKIGALSSQEMDLVEGFRSLTDEAKDVMLKKVRLLACIKKTKGGRG